MLIWAGRRICRGAVLGVLGEPAAVFGFGVVCAADENEKCGIVNGELDGLGEFPPEPLVSSRSDL